MCIGMLGKVPIGREPALYHHCSYRPQDGTRCKQHMGTKFASVHTAAHRLEVVCGCPLHRPASWPDWTYRAAHNAAWPCISACPADPHHSSFSQDQMSARVKGLSGAKAACIKLGTGDSHSPSHEWHRCHLKIPKGVMNAAVSTSTSTKQQVAAGNALKGHIRRL